MTYRTRAAAFAAGVFLLVSGSGRATEPDGFASIRWSWSAPDEAARGVGRLQVVVVPAVALRDADLTFEGPRGVILRAVPAAGGPPDGANAVALGNVPAGATVRAVLDVTAAAGAGGIASIRVHGTLQDGRRATDGAGIRVGQMPPPPTIRSGAAEYPAGRRP